MIYKRLFQICFQKESDPLPKHLHRLRQPVSIAATGHAESFLSAATALDFLGHLADELGGIQALGVGKGLSSVSKLTTKKNAEHTLRLELDDEIWDTLYGFQSEAINYRLGHKIAVRVISQFGEESTKVWELK